MAKRQIQFTKTCSDCIHESACRIWTDGRFISDTSASVCPNHETVKESSAYLCGVLDERKRKQTNADKIREMSDEELAKYLYQMQKYILRYVATVIGYSGEFDFADEVPDLLEWLQQSAGEVER